eukprot:s663_g4.t1
MRSCITLQLQTFAVSRHDVVKCGRCWPEADDTTEADDLSCSWVTCDCLQVSLQVPVELSLEGVETQLLTQDQRRIASELVRGSACGSVTRELGKPCGQCDGFRLERPQCYDTTAPPYRTFISAAPVHSVGMFTVLVLATFKLLADEFSRC